MLKIKDGESSPPKYGGSTTAPQRYSGHVINADSHRRVQADIERALDGMLHDVLAGRIETLLYMGAVIECFKKRGYKLREHWEIYRDLTENPSKIKDMPLSANKPRIPVETLKGLLKILSDTDAK